MTDFSRPATGSTQDARARLAHELHEGIKVEQAITILKPVSDLFAFWRDFSNLPKFMTRLKSVRFTTPLRTHWTWETVAGMTLDWEAEVIAELQDRMISWQTVGESLVNQAGSVWFRLAPQDGATEVHVQLIYRMPGVKIAKKVAELFNEEPTQTLHEDLRRLRWLMEAGEIPTTQGQPHGSEGLLH